MPRERNQRWGAYGTPTPSTQFLIFPTIKLKETSDCIWQSCGASSYPQVYNSISKAWGDYSILTKFLLIDQQLLWVWSNLTYGQKHQNYVYCNRVVSNQWILRNSLKKKYRYTLRIKSYLSYIDARSGNSKKIADPGQCCRKEII